MDPQMQLMLQQMMLQNQGRPRENPLARAFGGMPMYGGTPIMPSQMFDLGVPGMQNGPGGMMIGMMMQGILPSLMGPNFMPGQFTPTQNLFDHRYSIQYFMQRRQAVEQASRADEDTYFRAIRGMARMRGIEYEAGGAQEQSARRFARDITSVTPILGDMFPELIDNLSGIRGSSAIMAQKMFEAGRYQFDPATGRLGMSGESAGIISQDVFNRLYGPGADLTRMRGLGAGRAGQLYDELTKRGFGVPAFDGEKDAMNKLGRDVDRMNPQAIDAALRSFNAQKVSQTIERMAGAVAAMKDIFGDMGRPNAPMVELLNGLQALTQGGLSHMTPHQIENSVRQTYAIAKYTGLGLEGILGFAGSAGQTLDAIGYNRAFAPALAQGSAAYGFAFGLAGQPNNFGAMDREKASQLDLQLRINSLQSAQVSRLSALMRFSEEYSRPGGGKGFMEAGEAAAIAAAVRAGETTYSFGGRDGQSIYKSAAQMQAILGREGIDRNDITAEILQNPAAAQRIANKYNLQDLIRRGQGQLDFAPTIGGVFTQSVGTSLADRKDISVQERARLSSLIGRSLISDARKLFDSNPEFFDQDQEQARDVKLAEMLQQQLGNRLQGLGKEELANIVGNAFQRGEAYVQRPGSKFKSAGSLLGAFQIFSDKTQRLSVRTQTEAKAIADFQSVLAGIGQQGLAARISDYLQDVGPGGGSIQDFVFRSLGGIPVPEITSAGMALMDRLTNLQTTYGQARTQQERNRIMSDAKILSGDLATIINSQSLNGLSPSAKAVISGYEGMSARSVAGMVGAGAGGPFGALGAGMGGSLAKDMAGYADSARSYGQLLNRRLDERKDVQEARQKYESARQAVHEAEMAHNAGIPGSLERLEQARRAFGDAESNLSRVEAAASESVEGLPDVRAARGKMEAARGVINEKNRLGNRPELGSATASQIRMTEARLAAGKARDAAIGQMPGYRAAQERLSTARSNLDAARASGDASAIKTAENELSAAQKAADSAYHAAEKELTDHPDMKDPLQREFSDRMGDLQRLRGMPGSSRPAMGGQIPAGQAGNITLSSARTTIPDAHVQITAKELHIAPGVETHGGKDEMKEPTTGAKKGGEQKIIGTLTIEKLDEAIINAKIHDSRPTGTRG